MNTKIKSILVCLMVIALAFGFLAGNADMAPYNPERLHVFLFNLCSGGTILIYYSERLHRMTLKSWSFLCVSLCYAICAFLELYSVTLVCSVILAYIVESVREKRYSIFPYDFFRSEVKLSEKFNNASLLCLFLGLIISSLVIINNAYFMLVKIEKLKLDTFFLGFSFPLSLITMSVMFSLMENDGNLPGFNTIKNACFWSVNLGVIIFFCFILMEKIAPQVVVTSILFLTVVAIFILFIKSVTGIQQKTFLVSGMLFLIYTAVTGILYIILHYSPVWYDRSYVLLMKLHTFSALYGWNLSGLAVICRYKNFPIRLNSSFLVAMHWAIVAILAPLGYYNRVFAVFAVLSYLVFLSILFFSKEKLLGDTGQTGDTNE